MTLEELKIKVESKDATSQEFAEFVYQASDNQEHGELVKEFIANIPEEQRMQFVLANNEEGLDPESTVFSVFQGLFGRIDNDTTKDNIIKSFFSQFDKEQTKILLCDTVFTLDDERELSLLTSQCTMYTQESESFDYLSELLDDRDLFTALFGASGNSAIGSYVENIPKYLENDSFEKLLKRFNPEEIVEMSKIVERPEINNFYQCFIDPYTNDYDENNSKQLDIFYESLGHSIAILSYEKKEIDFKLVTFDSKVVKYEGIINSSAFNMDEIDNKINENPSKIETLNPFDKILNSQNIPSYALIRGFRRAVIEKFVKETPEVIRKFTSENEEGSIAKPLATFFEKFLPDAKNFGAFFTDTNNKFDGKGFVEIIAEQKKCKKIWLKEMSHKIVKKENLIRPDKATSKDRDFVCSIMLYNLILILTLCLTMNKKIYLLN